MEGINQPSKTTLFVREENGMTSFPKSYCEYFPDLVLPSQWNKMNSCEKRYSLSSKEELFKRKIEFTHAENWYPELEDAKEGTRKLTFDSVLIPFEFSPEEKKKKIQIAIDGFGGKAFIRLNSVSPKHQEPVTSAQEAIDILNGSERTREVFGLYKNYIMVREYKELPRNMEFRLFVRKGKLRAISRYDVYDFSPLDPTRIRSVIKQWFSSLQRENLDLFDDYTMDVVLWEENKEESLFDDGVFIIEYNSYGPDSLAGSCLFHWENDWEILSRGDAVIRI